MIKVQRRIHPMYKEYEELRQFQGFFKPTLPQVFGKYQWFYIKDNVRISLIECVYRKTFGIPNQRLWEICGGGLTDDCESFHTKEDAEERIKELLKDNISDTIEILSEEELIP